MVIEADIVAGAGGRKVALVTGGAIRVGRAIARLLGESSAVAVHCYQSVEEGEALCATLPDATLFSADLTRPGAAGHLVDAVIERFGRLDLLVNNAALFIPDVAPVQELARMKVLNVDAPARLIDGALPHLEKTGGAVVLIADVAALAPFQRFRAYSASKAALLSLCAERALALAECGVRINAVCPGIVLPPDEPSDALLAAIPLRRFGTPDDVAKLVDFLFRSTFITGQTIAVDGGRLLRMNRK